MSLNQIVVFAGIVETVQEKIQEYVTLGLNLFSGLSVWVQAAAVLGAAIFILIGFVQFIKKTYKVLIVLAIVGVVGYLLYTNGVLDDLIGNLMPTTTSAGAIVQHVLRALPL